MKPSPNPLPADLPVAELRAKLLGWFDAHGRDLPWRRTPTLYGTWISEVMLQQTTVASVVPYWRRFLARFPDVAALAAADTEEVLAHWSGLGYYRRARQLHASARIIVAERGGRLPTDREGWAGLPGIGPYASGAIASIGLGERVAAMDANARRVIARWACGDLATRDRMSAAAVDRLGEELVSPDRPGNWNEAVMELGAVVCGARLARCEACPVRPSCRASAAGIVAEVPATARPQAAVPARVGLLAVVRGGRVLLVPPGTPPVGGGPDAGAVVRDDFRALHRGLWGLPMTRWFADTPRRGARLPATVWQDWLAARRGGWSAVGAAASGIERAGVFAHGITRYRLQVEVFVLALLGPDPAPRAARGGTAEVPSPRFFAFDEEPLPVSRLAAKALRLARPIAG